MPGCSSAASPPRARPCTPEKANVPMTILSTFTPEISAARRSLPVADHVAPEPGEPEHNIATANTAMATRLRGEKMPMIRSLSANASSMLG